MRASLTILVLALACDGPRSSDAGTNDAGRDASSSDASSDAGDERDAGDEGDAGERDAGDDGGSGCVGPPGLYEGDSCTELAEGIRPYHPRYELWSDGADKERFVYLPPGTQIDTSDPNRWGFPEGTRLYKTFSLGGLRLETRVLEKIDDARGVASWSMRSYAWSADQRSVSEVGPLGVLDVLGTDHDIPTWQACERCHSVAQDDAINGFSAIQLAHDDGGVTLAALLDEGLLSDPIALADATIPGNAVERAALGYLHANCGSCHGGPEPEHDLDLWVPVGATDVALTPTFATAVCGCSVWTATTPEGELLNLRVAPGHAERSVITHRMGTRAFRAGMPPIASEAIDLDGIRVVSEWIDSLAEDANGCPHGCPFP